MRKRWMVTRKSCRAVRWRSFSRPSKKMRSSGWTRDKRLRGKCHPLRWWCWRKAGIMNTVTFNIAIPAMRLPLQKTKVGCLSCVCHHSEKTSENPDGLDRSGEKTLLKIARQTIANKLVDADEAPAIRATGLKHWNCTAGAFSHLTKNGQLRGCIGHFGSDEPLYKNRRINGRSSRISKIQASIHSASAIWTRSKSKFPFLHPWNGSRHQRVY